MNTLDIIVIGVLIFDALINYKRGLVLALFSFFSLALSMAIGTKIYPILTEFLKTKTPVYNALRGSVASKVSEKTITVDDIVKMPLPQSIKDDLNKSISENVGTALIDKITEFGIKAIALIVVVIVVSIGLRIVAQILNVIASLPVLNFFNKNLGLVFGILIGIFHVWLGCMALVYLALDVKHAWIFAQLQSSLLAKYFYDNNLLLNLIGGIFK